MDVKVDIKNVRKEYRTDLLEKKDLEACPIKMFEKWFTQAREVETAIEPNMMSISTVGLDGAPNSRYVLLKEVSQGGFVFFTNYESTKGEELEKDPRIALLFYWPTLNWQVRVKGEAKKVPDAESEDYFKQRPLKSQAGAACSHQSKPLPDDKSQLVGKVHSVQRNPRNCRKSRKGRTDNPKTCFLGRLQSHPFQIRVLARRKKSLS